MPDEKTKDADQVVADSMNRLFSGLSSACANPLTATKAKSLTGKLKIIGVVLKENDQPAAGVSIGFGGVECRTDTEGRFSLLVEKK